MKRTLLLFSLVCIHFGYAQNTNLVSNGKMEQFNSPNSTPNDWSSSSDFGEFTQNTRDFSEGSSSLEMTAGFSDLSMFTLVDIPLEAGKTYIIKYSYKYLGSNFDSNNNIEFSFFLPTTPFVHGTNIQDNNWNTVETQFTPTVTKSDFEASIKIIPAGFGDYSVLIDDIQVFESTGLSNINLNLENNINVLTLPNKQVKITKSADIIISKVNLFSILGQEKKLNINSGNSTILNLDAVSSGIYILKISTNKGSISKKILLK